MVQKSVRRVSSVLLLLQLMGDARDELLMYARRRRLPTPIDPDIARSASPVVLSSKHNRRTDIAVLVSQFARVSPRRAVTIVLIRGRRGRGVKQQILISGLILSLDIYASSTRQFY